MKTTTLLVILLMAVGLVWSADSLDFPDRSGDIDENVFNFVRIRYNGYISSWAGRRWDPPWAHDYDRAERNFLKILSELTTIETNNDAYLILDLNNPEIMKYPVLYVSEPGYWNCTEQETSNLREYFDRGGFVIFDDFRNQSGEWNNFASCMKQVYPDRPIEELTVDHPVFHCFFDIEDLDMVSPYPVPGRPTFYGMHDEDGRLQMVANFNNDIGDYWEWSDTSLAPIELSNEAYRFGVNYIIYALTH
jgi:hypothetical protein